MCAMGKGLYRWLTEDCGASTWCQNICPGDIPLKKLRKKYERSYSQVEFHPFLSQLIDILEDVSAILFFNVLN